MPSIDSIAQALFGGRRVEEQTVETDATTRTYIGIATSGSEEGTVSVDLDGDVTTPDDLVDENGDPVDEYSGAGVEIATSPYVEEGDEVMVTLVGGGPLKTPMVTAVAGAGDRTMNVARAANTIAEAAQAVADAVNQHFWHDSNGIHVTEVTQEAWQATQTGANVLINSLGQLFRNGTNNLLALLPAQNPDDPTAIAIFDGLGNLASNIFARFGTDGAQIGYTDKSHMKLDYHSMSMVDKDGNPYFDVRDLRDENGNITETQALEGDGEKTRFNLNSLTEPDFVTIDGVETTDYTWELDEDDEAWVTFATAPADGSAIIVGYYVAADGTYKSFAMGDGAMAEGRHSLALGRGAKVTSNTAGDQMALGRYNRSSEEDYYIDEHALIIGNGTDDAHRSNAASIDWNGRAQFHGDYVRISHMVDSQSAMFSAERPDTERVVRFGMGAGGQNRGIWDGYLANRGDVDVFFPGDPDATRDGGWLFWADSDNNTHIRDWEPRILSQETSASVSVANAKDSSIVTLQINEPGCWILIAHAVFNSNATGRRVMGITTSANASLGTGASSPIISQAPASGGGTAMTVIDVVSVGWTGGLTRYLTLYQNSGGALSCTGSIKAVRVMMPA